MTIDTLTRPCVHRVTPYLPGKPIAEVQRELGLKKVVKLASNENPLGPSPKAVAALRRALIECHLYPEGASPLLRRALARELDLSEHQVLIGNGSDEIIRLICEAFLSPDDEVIVSEYGFIRFKQQSMLMGAKVIEAPMREWRHDLAAMGRVVSDRTKLLFVASPNNPTGTYNAREELAALLRALPDSAILVLDEAYQHYAAGRPDYPDSVREFLPHHPNLVILRTFSKAYGLAGLRVGYGVAHAKLVGWLDRVRMPFNVNLPAQRAAVEALKDHAFVRKSVASTQRDRGVLTAALRRMGFEAVDSAANFVFARSVKPGREIFKRLLRSGIIIRPLDEYGLTHHIRISVGTAAQNKAFVSALESVLKES